MKYYFCTGNKGVYETSKPICHQCLEVTKKYANYLRAVPDDLHELRQPLAGEEFLRRKDDPYSPAILDFADCGPSDRGYRWCLKKEKKGKPPTEGKAGLTIKAVEGASTSVAME